MEALLVLCTCANRAEADRLARTLVEEQLAACVNILPGIRSIYRWEGAVEEAEEVLLLIKTTEAGFPRLRDRIFALHRYETPEVIALPISEGSGNYLAWLQSQVK